MLQEISIRDFAIVDAVDIHFNSGMTAITGETGAGKSLLVDAMHLLLGGRADNSVVRSGAKRARVTGLYLLDDSPKAKQIIAQLEELGIDVDDDNSQLLVRRDLPAKGRGRVFINDVPVTVASLRELMRGVVDIMSQHEHQSLASREAQREMLDAFGDHHKLRAEYSAQFEHAKTLQIQLNDLHKRQTDKAARLDYLQFQRKELHELAPQEGEFSALEKERRNLASVDKLRIEAGRAEALLYSDDRAAGSLVDQALQALHSIIGIDENLGALHRNLDDAKNLIADVGLELNRYLDRLNADPQHLQEIEDRLASLRQVARKHGVGADELSLQLDKLNHVIEELQDSSEQINNLEDELAQAIKALAGSSQKLSMARQKTGTRLIASCTAALRDLAMDRAQIQLQIEALPGRGEHSLQLADGRWLEAHGADQVELLLQANPGEPARPLNKVASGGELSRIALALRRALADKDPVPTYIFDEVDAAIGGSTAEAVGQALRHLAKGHQVLCVTHLPQVAALAQHQLRVEKEVEADRTRTLVSVLNDDERVDELARMLGGSHAVETAKKHARSLMQVST